MRTNPLSTPRSCSAAKYCSLWAMGVRRSASPVISSVGVDTSATRDRGERRQ